MDPKMDNGLLRPGETLEEDYDVLQELGSTQLLAIMDGLLSSEV